MCTNEIQQQQQQQISICCQATCGVQQSSRHLAQQEKRAAGCAGAEGQAATAAFNYAPTQAPQPGHRISIISMWSQDKSKTAAAKLKCTSHSSPRSALRTGNTWVCRKASHQPFIRVHHQLLLLQLQLRVQLVSGKHLQHYQHQNMTVTT